MRLDPHAVRLRLLRSKLLRARIVEPVRLAFRDAARIFDGPTVERTDDRYDYGEMRIYAIGLVNNIEITVIYTDRDPDERHIISAWRSEPHERRYFWNHLDN